MAVTHHMGKKVSGLILLSVALYLLMTYYVGPFLRDTFAPELEIVPLILEKLETIATNSWKW